MTTSKSEENQCIKEPDYRWSAHELLNIKGYFNEILQIVIPDGESRVVEKNKNFYKIEKM